MATVAATLSEQEMITLKESRPSQHVLQLSRIRFASPTGSIELPVVSADTLNGQFGKILSAHFPLSFPFDNHPLILVTFYPYEQEDETE